MQCQLRIQIEPHQIVVGHEKYRYSQLHSPVAPGLTGRVIALAVFSCRPTVGLELDQPTVPSWLLVRLTPTFPAPYPLRHTSYTTNTNRL